MIAKRLSPLVILTVSMLGLASCDSGDPSSSPTSSAGVDAATIAAVKWADGDDGVPVLTFEYPLLVSDGASQLIEDGDGEVIAEGQVISIDYVLYSGVDGSITFSTYDQGAPEPLTLDEESLAPALWSVLVGNHVGARILFAAPDYSVTTEDGSIPSSVVAITVVGTTAALDRAEGEAVAPIAGLPTITLAEDGAPSIDFTGAAMPSALVVQPLIAGTGIPVTEGQSITVHYTGWLWDGEVFDSSWEGVPRPPSLSLKVH